jgi:L-fucose isomerase-like protein
MKKFEYILAASVLHDQAGIRGIFDKYEPLLNRAGGLEVAGTTGRKPGDGVFYFILTGGTEAFVLESLKLRGLEGAAGKNIPLVLIAHGKQNSLPAALELAAWARQRGRASQVIQLAGTDDAKGQEELEATAALVQSLSAMRKSKIGLVGKPSDWLVASNQAPEIVKASWGTTVLPIAFQRLVEAMETEQQGEKRSLPESFIRNASYRREASDEDLGKSELILRALKTLVEKEKLDGLSLRCFDLLTLNESTGCFALAQLASEGIDAGCEGDVPSIVALRWMRILSGKPAWMANPSVIRKKEGGKGNMLIAHCTVPLSLVPEYGIRSHFESGKGAAISGSLPKGPVTLVRIGGTKLDTVWAAEGWLKESPSGEGLCRTQAVIELANDDIDVLLKNPLGNHLVMALGNWVTAIDRYTDWAGLNRI